MKEMARYGAILAVICFISSAVLAVVNGFTEPQIKMQKEKEEKAALSEVMPQAASFKPREEGGKTLYYKAYDNNGKLVGFVVKAEGKGYSSVIESLAGLDLKLEITDVKVISQNETPGLGTRVTGGKFLGQFKGKGLADFGRIDAITSSTISSEAVINSIKGRITQLQEELKQEAGNAG